MNLNLKGDSCDARHRNPRTEASDYRVLPGESMLHSQTLVDQLGHVALLQGHMPWAGGRVAEGAQVTEAADGEWYDSAIERAY